MARMFSIVFAVQACFCLAAESNNLVRNSNSVKIHKHSNSDMVSMSVSANGRADEIEQPAMKGESSDEALALRVQNMLEDVESMANSGVTPAKDKIKTIKDIVKDELIPDLKATRKSAADQVTVNLGSIDTCNANTVSRLGTIKSQTEASVGQARTTHATCREAEKEKTSTKGKRCKELDDFLAGVNDPQNMPAGRARAAMVNYVKAMSSYYCPKGPEATKLDEACDAATKEHKEHKSNCDGLQAAFESGYCTWRTELHDACVENSDCYEAAMKVYNDHKAATTELVAKWKVEYAALKKIECYVDVWLSDNDVNTVSQDKFESCRASDIDTSPMNVDFGTPADKAQCSLDAVQNHPGTDGFVSTEYSAFKEFAVQVIACLPLGGETVSTQQAQSENTATATPEATLPPEQECSDLNKDVQKSCAMPMWHDLINLEAQTVSMMCTPKLVLTKGSTCEQWCSNHGYHCLRAQDNTKNTCNLDDKHTRQSTADNGCNQKWNNQVCQCGKKA